MDNSRTGFLKIHVVEFGSHFQILVAVGSMFAKTVPTVIHGRFVFQGAWRPEIGRFVGETKIVPARQNRYLSSLVFYLRILFSVRVNHLVWVTTGPEHAVIPDLVVFALMVLRFRSRLVLCIRDSGNWMGRPSGGVWLRLAALGRQQLVRQVRRIVFESEAQLRTFSNHYGYLPARLTTSPTMFSDSGIIWTDEHETDALGTFQPRERVGIGLLGGVDPRTRDYSELIEALRLNAAATQVNLELVILGRTTHPLAPAIIRQLSKYAHVDVSAGYLSQSKLLKKSRQCSILVAPLAPGLDYGNTRGTGAYGDSLVSGVMVALPSHVAQNFEFDGLTVRYSSSGELQELIGLAAREPALFRIKKPELGRYSTSTIRKKLFDDLGIVPR